MIEVLIIAECYVDTAIVSYIRNGTYPIHAEGITGVAKMMSEKPSTFCIGVVDNDKRFAPYLKQFKEVEKRHGLSLRKHPTYNQHIIVVGTKDAEEWLEEQLRKCDKTLKDFKFQNFGHFENTTKNSEKDPKVLALLNTLKQKQAAGFVTIGNWIEQLAANAESKKPPKRRKRKS